MNCTFPSCAARPPIGDNSHPSPTHQRRQCTWLENADRIARGKAKRRIRVLSDGLDARARSWKLEDRLRLRRRIKRGVGADATFVLATVRHQTLSREFDLGDLRGLRSLRTVPLEIGVTKPMDLQLALT